MECKIKICSLSKWKRTILCKGSICCPFWCNPSPDQRVIYKNDAGKYRPYQHLILKVLVNSLTCGKNVEPSYVKNLLFKNLPKRKSISNNDIWNTIVCARMLVTKLKQRDFLFWLFFWKKLVGVCNLSIFTMDNSIQIIMIITKFPIVWEEFLFLIMNKIVN